MFYLQGKLATIDDVEVLYKSEHFIAVNKHTDVKINSDNPADRITVANQIAKMFPECVDSSAAHHFRFSKILPRPLTP